MATVVVVGIGVRPAGEARAAGWTPSVRRFSAFGLVIVPATMSAALGALAVAH